MYGYKYLEKDSNFNLVTMKLIAIILILLFIACNTARHTVTVYDTVHKSWCCKYDTTIRVKDSVELRIKKKDSTVYNIRTVNKDSIVWNYIYKDTTIYNTTYKTVIKYIDSIVMRPVYRDSIVRIVKYIDSLVKVPKDTTIFIPVYIPENAKETNVNYKITIE